MSGRRLSAALSLPVAALLLVAGCDRGTTLTAPGPGGAQFSRAPSRPFRFELTGNANPDFSQGPCNVPNTESGTGQATHLGRVTWSTSEVANFCVDPNDPSRGAVTGTLVITAANGDQLTASYQTTLSVDFASGTLTATGPFVVTGGTGRFAGATGGGTATASGSLAPPFGVTGTFVGTIAY